MFDLVRDDVAEAAGLGDLWNAVGDEPGFVAVAEAVEDQARHDCLEMVPGAGLVEGPIGSGARRATGEVAAAQKLVVLGEEYMGMGMGVGVEMGSEHLDEKRRKGDGTGGLLGLRRA